MSQSDDRSVETTASDKSSIGSDDTTTDPAVVIAIVELDGLFDEGGNGHAATDNTFISKIRIYQSEVVADTPPSLSDNDEGAGSHINGTPPLRTNYTYTAQQLRNKINFHFAGRIMIPAAGSNTGTRRFGDDDAGYYHIYVYNNSANEYIPLPDNDDTTNVIPLFGTRWRIRVVYTVNDSGNTNQNKAASTPLLAIQGRFFHDDIHEDGTVSVGEYKLQVLPPNSSPSTVDGHAGTGYHVWDGALLLIRYLESSMNHREFVDQHALELGSGCGVVGMTAALLGANSVTLTDLPELQPFLQANVDTNLSTIQQAREQQSLASECIITCESCDWTQSLSPAINTKTYDFILIADCIWIESLVAPLFATLRDLTAIDTHRPLKRQSLVMDDLKSMCTRVPETILEDKVANEFSALFCDPNKNMSISHMDLNKSKISLDESPVNSDADIYHNQSSQQLSGLVHFSNSCSSSMDHSSASVQLESDGGRITTPLSLSSSLLDQQSHHHDPEKKDALLQHRHSTTVLISYQRRGKSTHETFIRELYELFTVVETITVPSVDYPQDRFFLYSCRR